MKKIKAGKQTTAPAGEMTLTGHLKELRNRIAVCIVVLIVGIGICLAFASRIVEVLTQLGSRFDYHYVYIAPQELLMVYFTISLLGGVVIAVPVIAYEAYAFAGPGLEKKEKRTFRFALLFGALFFCIGVAFAYTVTVPFMLRFLKSFSVGTAIQDNISIGEYISFLLTVFVIFGVVFEMPVISVILTKIGILRAEWMAKARRVMIVVIFVVAAIITPPDIVSQVMVAIPMIALFEFSIVLSRVFGRKKAESEEDDDSGDDE